jgi:mRNA interferase HigB
MHVISRKKLRQAVARHPDLAGPLDAWFRIAKKTAWLNLASVRETFASADSAGKFTIFNIKGNNYRLIAEINYAFGRLYIRHVLTHAEAEKRLAELLTLLIEDFEEKHYGLEPSAPIEVLNELMLANNLKQKDLLDVFGTPSIASEVMSGKRQLTTQHIRRLSRRFKVSPELFF